MKKNLILFIILILNIMPLSYSYDHLATSIGTGGSNFALLNGFDALSSNPANILLFKNNKYEFSFVMNLSGYYFNGVVPNSILYFYNMKYLKHDNIFKKGSETKFIKSLTNDATFNFGGNIDLLAFNIGSFAFKSTLVSNSRLFFNSSEANLFDNNYLNYQKAHLQHPYLKSMAVIENSFGWSIPIDYRNIPLNSIFNKENGLFGFSFKYLVGISYADVKFSNIVIRDTLGVTKVYEGSYIDLISSGLELSLNSDSTLPDSIGEEIRDNIGPAGHGFAMDFGFSWYDSSSVFSIAIRNLLGFMLWNKNIYNDKIFFNNNVINEFNKNEDLLIYTQNKNNSIKTKDALLKLYPLSLDFGYSKIFHFNKNTWLSKSFIFSTSVRQNFWNSAFYGVIPRVSVGIQNNFFNGVMPLYLGTSFGGDEEMSFSAGIGLDLKYFVLNAGVRGYKNVLAHKSNGISVSAGIVFKFGYDGDNDHDGILNSKDKCKNTPEDFDGYQDDDGCPEYDNDSDGIPDSLDKCPLTAEDRDGFEDLDGCPEYDNDNDGIPDSLDKCPLLAEDFDGYQDDDGCPEYDNDGDGIPDSLDKCPLLPETIDGYQDDDGCPEYDKDKDGIPDSLDKCPLAPETYNNYLDDDGCPDTPPAPKKKEIKILKQALKGLQFKVNSFNITKDSYALLDQIVMILQGKDYLRYLIEGHTDISGDYNYNIVLSRLRAKAVKDYLISKGISSDRLLIIGYGPDKPIASNKTAAGRKKNRRIEFKQIMTNEEYEQLKKESKENQKKIEEILNKYPSFKRKLGL